MSQRIPSPLSTTGIGSLPHTQRELALQMALSVDVPYLPQLPQRSAAEFMLPQALEGLPGMMFDNEGSVSLDLDVWKAHRNDLQDGLEKVLAGEDNWEPGAHHWAAWSPFCWEVQERKLPFAKVQIAGPVTTRWALKTTEGAPCSEVPELGKQVAELILARALSMVRTIASEVTTPIVFLDEPGLFALDPTNPRQQVAVRELKIALDVLRKEGALVGLHCCSNTHWETILGLEPDYVAVDAMLSLLPLVNTGQAFDDHIARGGGLLLGVVPTNTTTGKHYVNDLIDTTLAVLRQHAHESQVTAEKVLARTLLSPACGLGMRSTPDCEQIFEDLKTAREQLTDSVGQRLASTGR